MSANPRSPESGDVPEWLAKIVADVRFATARGDGRGECYRAIHALADALDSESHLLRDVLQRMGITHEGFGLDAGWWLNGEPEPQRFTTLNEALGAYDAMLSRLTAELSTARERADRAEDKAVRMLARVVYAANEEHTVRVPEHLLADDGFRINRTNTATHAIVYHVERIPASTPTGATNATPR